MSNPSDSLREKLKALKPHTNKQLPFGNLLSFSELEAIMSLIEAHSLQERNQLIGEVEAQTVKLWNKYSEPPLIDGHEILDYLNELRKQLEAEQEN